MKVLAIDQASASGWAVGDANSIVDKTVESGVFKMPKRPILGERLVIFHDTLSELIEFYRPTLIAYETPYSPPPFNPHAPGAAEKRSKISVETLNLLQKIEGMLIFTATKHNVEYESYMSASWRVTALGMGRAPKGSDPGILKRMMVAKARALGFEPGSEDEADAIGILIHATMGKPAAARAQFDLLDMAADL